MVRRVASSLVRGLRVGLLLATSLPAEAQTAAASRPAPEAARVWRFEGLDGLAPFQYIDEKGEPQGFNVDLIRAIARVSGRPIQVRLRKGGTLDDLFAHGKPDLTVITYTEDRANQYGFLDEIWTVRLSAFFLPTRVSVPSGLSELKSEVVAVRAPSLSQEILAALPDAQRPTLVVVKDNKEAVELLRTGRVTSAAGGDISLRTELSRVGLGEAKELLVKANPYRLATTKGREGEFAFVSEALRVLRETGEFSRIVEKHLAYPKPEGALREFAQRAAFVIAVLAVTSALVLAWNRSLRIQVAARTARLAEASAKLERSLVEIREANEQLGLKNAELERFTYTVSHDLRSPLITIRGYLGHLVTSVAEGNEQRFREDVTRIDRATAKMDDLLRDLLELSRVGRVLNPVSDVPMAAVAQDAADLLRGPLRARGASVEIDPELPLVRGDRKRLLEVFQNLVENAVKFMGDQKEPRITVGVRRESGEVVFFVRDNGIGIDPKHRERVFELFERLTPTGEGTGVGLALVKRIVEAHGGRVWVESPEVGVGAVFCFTVSKGAPEGLGQT
jgi:signal transduction histidine kinase